MKDSRSSFVLSVRRHAQRGMTAVEFSFIALFVFIPLLLGITEFGRWLFLLNGANEATRLGARLATVCSIETPGDLGRIKAKMSAMTGGGISASKMVLEYEPTGCDASDCKTVTARIVGATFSPIHPYLGATFQIPEFATTLPREYMNSTGNPVCP